MASADVSGSLTLDGRDIPLTRLNKILYPGSKFTKAQVIDYYVRVAPYLLPHLADRPVSLKRFPNGVRAEAYWDKDVPSFAPKWVKTFPVPRRNGGPDIRYVVIADTATLAWTANIAAIELHPFLHRVPKIQQPASVVFDLDPGEGTGILQCIEVALLLRKLFHHLSLELFPKVSGSKGIQLYLPLNTPASYAATQPFARAVAELIERQRPELAISVMAREKRAGKVFIDWSQNADFKTTVGVYSLRAKSDTPYVSMPVKWEELETAKKRRNPDSLYFDAKTALRRLEKTGDLFAQVLELKQKLPSEPPQTLETPKRAPRARTMELRRSAQGGKRRFALNGRSLTLEIGKSLMSWDLPRGMPRTMSAQRPAIALGLRPLESFSADGAREAGTYELIEGTWRSGRMHFALAGKTLGGEYLLSKSGTEWGIEKVA